jgi:tRNA dimethylallyltransferase
MIAILGPTASGKSAVAHRLALATGGEIISCDSMQVYQGLEIGTAQPTEAEKKEVPYHLTGELDITASWNAHQHKIEALDRVRQIHERGKTAFLVGGTGMYAKAILYDLSMQPADSAEYAEIFKTSSSENGRQKLIQEIRKNAPDFDIPPDLIANPRRLARAVEILRVSGSIPDNFCAMPETRKLSQRSDSTQFILLPPTDEHRQRIRNRTKKMLESGWIHEVEALRNRGFFETPTARQALGYSRVREFLEGTIDSEENLIERIVIDTWKYARRQRTWFRHQHPGAYLLTLRRNVSVDAICQAILALKVNG